MDMGRNLEVLAEEDSEEEEVDDSRKKNGSSDDSDSDDDEPDPSSRREPNKFDNLCDGVTNAMAYVHGSMQELLNMKDEMLRHALPPTLLIKLATVTGKVFRSMSDLNMPVNELVRLVRVYSTPWEEKSAALKKLHEDYENKQRQLNIAVKRLQLVDAHSKRIAREKRIMNWEKLFAKIMSNKGHGRRWKFLIETIKQKAKLGLEHVQEYTRALEESSDEDEEDEEDDMPMTLKRPGEDSDKLSDLEEGEEDDEKTSTAKDEDSEEVEKSEKEEEDSTRVGSSKKVRFASPEEPPQPEIVKPEVEDISVWTEEPEYDYFLYCRVFQPTKVEEKELKIVVTFGEQIKKTKRLDVARPTSQPEPEKEEAKQTKGRGLIGMRAKPPEDKMAQFKKEAEERKAEMEAKTSEEVCDSKENKESEEMQSAVKLSEKDQDIKTEEMQTAVKLSEKDQDTKKKEMQTDDQLSDKHKDKKITDPQNGEVTAKNSATDKTGDTLLEDENVNTNSGSEGGETKTGQENADVSDKAAEIDSDTIKDESSKTDDTESETSFKPDSRKRNLRAGKRAQSDSKITPKPPPSGRFMLQQRRRMGMKQSRNVRLKENVAPHQHTNSDSPEVTPHSKDDPQAEYHEIYFDIPEYFGNDSIWRKGKENEPKSLKLSVHKGPLEEMFAMATIDIDDIFDQGIKTVYLAEPHGDDDVPPPPGKIEELDALSDDLELNLSGINSKNDDGPPVEKHEELKKVEQIHFPIYALNPKKSDNVHDPCGNVPLIFYIAKRRKPKVYNRNNGTVPFNDFILDIAGIDLQTWRKEDFFKETESRAASAMEWQPEVQVKVVEKEVIKEVIVKEEKEVIKEVFIKEEPEIPEEIEVEKSPEPPKEETVTKAEYDQLVEKHSNELQLLQDEYEKRLQALLENLQQMQQTQLEQKELLEQQQKYQQSRPPLVHQRPVSSSSKRSSASGGRMSVGPTTKSPSLLQPSTMVSPSQDITIGPKTPGTVDTLTPTGFESHTETHPMRYSMPEPPQQTRRNFKVGKPLPNWGSNVPEDVSLVLSDKFRSRERPFLSRLAWFEDASKRHHEENQERTMRTIQEEMEKKLAGQHKLSRKEEEIYDAMRDVSLPALFMPTKNRAAVYNPRAHQYFHPTGSTDLRLSQPPSVFQLPPLSTKTRMSVVNLFELSRNFSRKGQAWLLDKYIEQQEPLQNVHGMVPQTPVPPITAPMTSVPVTPYNDTNQSVQGTSNKDREPEMEI